MINNARPSGYCVSFPQASTPHCAPRRCALKCICERSRISHCKHAKSTCRDRHNTAFVGATPGSCVKLTCPAFFRGREQLEASLVAATVHVLVATSNLRRIWTKVCNGCAMRSLCSKSDASWLATNMKHSEHGCRTIAVSPVPCAAAPPVMQSNGVDFCMLQHICRVAAVFLQWSAFQDLGTHGPELAFTPGVVDDRCQSPVLFVVSKLR